MAKGPGTIYKDCIAEAVRTEQTSDDKLILEANKKFGMMCLLEQQVKKMFLMADYGPGKTERYITQWTDLSVVARVSYKGYRLICFNELPSAVGVRKK